MNSPCIAGITGLLQEAAQWRLLGLLFRYPDERWRSQLRALASDWNEGPLLQLARLALETATPGIHLALFGPGGRIPVREVSYQGGVQLGYLMAELAAFYEVFDYRPDGGEAGDHVAVQADFLGYLKLKQAFALDAGEHEAAAIAAEAAEAFLHEHLAVLAEPLSKALANGAPDYLVQAGRMLLQQAGPAPRSRFPCAATVERDEEEMTCSAPNATRDWVQPER